jgi:hypothetical protein
MAQTKDRPVEKMEPSRSAFGYVTAAEADAAGAAQLKRNIEARDRTIEEFGVRTLQELAAAGLYTNAVFSVWYRDAEVFPGFQFDEQGRPVPAIAEILEILRDIRSPWQIALWFTGANLWLRGERPVDVLRSAHERVIEAARHEAEELVF